MRTACDPSGHPDMARRTAGRTAPHPQRFHGRFGEPGLRVLSRRSRPADRGAVAVPHGRVPHRNLGGLGPRETRPWGQLQQAADNSEDAKKLDELLHAKRCALQVPTSLRAGPTAWREFLIQEARPSTWTGTIKFQVMAGLGVIQPQEVALMLLETFKDLNQEVVTTGYWPKRNITNSWYPHVSTIVQCICDAVAPTEGIFIIKVQLNNSNSSKGPKYMVAAIRITGTQVIIGRWTGTGYVTRLKADFLSPGRQMILHAGRSVGTVPAPQRTELVKAGFSLRNIP